MKPPITPARGIMRNRRASVKLTCDDGVSGESEDRCGGGARFGEHREVSGPGDDLEGYVEGGGGDASARD
jgi:hypothetical protein